MRLTRREIIGGAAVAASAGAVFRCGFEQGPDVEVQDGSLRVADLIDRDERISELGRQIAGTTITVRGYTAPAMRTGALVDLHERPTGICLACGGFHDPGRSITIAGKANIGNFSYVRITGVAQVSEKGKLTIMT